MHLHKRVGNNADIGAHDRTREAVRRIVERADLDDFTERVLDSFWDRPEYRPFRPPRDDVRAWVRWNIDLVVRWLVDDRRPTKADIERFRERARGLAANGMPADVVPANFRRGARYAWADLLAAAREDERAALAERADLFLDFIDQVSQVFSDTYKSTEPAAAASGEERQAQELLGRVCAGDELIGEDHQVAERIGFELSAASRPFVLAAPGRSAHQHAAFARRLRAQHVLAASEGRRVVGLAHREIPWRGLGVGSRGVIAAGGAPPRGQLPEAFEELRMVVEVALKEGRSGAVDVDEYPAELLLRRSPRLAARLRARVYGQLAARDPELVRTLDALIEHDFDRGATAAALPVHRNTLSNRLNRIRAITGLAVDGADGRGLVWLAWVARKGGAGDGHMPPV